MISLTRRYRFSASHRLNSPALTDTENARVYGKCNNPFGHGHDYVLDITVSGAPDPQTGLLFPRAKLDTLVHERILNVFANRNLNLDVDLFRTIVPTTENLALAVAEIIEANWPVYLAGSSAWPCRIYIQETERNSFEVHLPLAHSMRRVSQPSEDIPISCVS